VALTVVSMKELKLEVLLEPERTGDSVVEVCRRRGVSRASYYRYRRRYLEEGRAGLEPRSRRPRGSPGRIAAALEAEIVTLRKRHPRWGAHRIHAELARAGTQPPAVATIHRALLRNHLVAPQPPRRRNAKLRFERPLANDLWQIDGTELRLADGRPACIVDCLDDHARFLLAALACPSPSGEAAWACFLQASSAYGLPRQLLSDNHLSFTGRLFGIEVAFERRLAQVGVQLINAAPAHPQTLGKLERFHRTLKEWLAEEGPALDLEHLQLLLDRFRAHYNGERPHQGIGNATPADRYLPGPPPASPPPGGHALGERGGSSAEPPATALRTVSPSGIVRYAGLAIIVGRRYAGARVQVAEIGELIQIRLREELVRALVADRSKPYQTLHKHRERRS
jgi:transposase InsO family protein